MNPDLDRLQSYPFQKLTALLHGITPNPDLAPISLYIGEPKHPTRMAGHVRFGARTGGALIILGVIIVVIALFFSGSVETIFKIFPAPILGVILFLTGAQLALGSCDFGEEQERTLCEYRDGGMCDLEYRTRICPWRPDLPSA